MVEPGETLEAAARRETEEETGLRVVIGADLGSVRQKSGKIVHAFLARVAPESEAAIDDAGRCTRHDDENDVCRFYPIDEARELMIEAQREFLDRLKRASGDSGASPSDRSALPRCQRSRSIALPPAPRRANPHGPGAPRYATRPSRPTRYETIR